MTQHARDDIRVAFIAILPHYVIMHVRCHHACMHYVYTVPALIYGVAKNNSIIDRSTSIRMH